MLFPECLQQQSKGIARYLKSCCRTFLQVSYEKKQLQQLNEQLATAGRRLAQSAWTTFQQRENLEVTLNLYLRIALFISQRTEFCFDSLVLLSLLSFLCAGFGYVQRRFLAPAMLPASKSAATSAFHRRLQVALPPDGLLQRVPCSPQV